MTLENNIMCSCTFENERIFFKNKYVSLLNFDLFLK